MVIISTSPEGLQRHLDTLFAWCQNNFLILNAAKSWVMIFGPIPPSLNPFSINSQSIPFTDTFKYVRVTFQSTAKDYFTTHYAEKISAARRNVGVLFCLELYVGRNRIPPQVTRTLYCALVDCHLIHAADIAPDISAQLLMKHSDLQKRCLQKILLVSKHSVIAPLYTESGIMPMAPRHVLLALRYLLYLIHLPNKNYSFMALQQSENLRNADSPSWLTDLDFAL